MGLDMYLTDRQGNELGYWRKANAIHGYIVRTAGENVDNCQKIKLSRYALQTLRSHCLMVLQDISKAKELLPPTEGFFFGSYEIDNWYVEDLKETVKIIDKALSETRKRTFIYQASW